jgi:hypothetical protein
MSLKRYFHGTTPAMSISSFLTFQENEPAIAVGSRAHLQDEAVAQVRKFNRIL